METKTKTYRMLKTAQGSRDGIHVETFAKGETCELDESLAEQFCHLGAVEEVSGEAKNPADARETKVSAPDEVKGGEADIDPATQRIEELVATARDVYGLEVDSTMSEEQIRQLIEDAEAESSKAEAEGKPSKKRKK